MRTVTIILCCLLLTACDKPKKNTHSSRPYQVKTSDFTSDLLFSGEIKPLRLTAVTSPVDATILEKHFRFGQPVATGDVLIKLDSPQLENEFNEALTAYLREKENYETANTKFLGTENLWQAGLVPRNTYITEKSNLSTTHVSMIRARMKLDETIAKIDSDNLHKVKQLDISDIKAVETALNRQYNIISLRAKQSGVLLEPAKTSTDDSKEKSIEIGSEVKQGQVVALIGNLDGISLNISIPEVNLEQVKPGQAVQITGVAFPGEILHGKITSVNSQASSAFGANNGLPTFDAQIQVEQLTEPQKKLIKVGMSATAKISMTRPNVITIPIQAVIDKQGRPFVQLQQGENIKEIPIVTGQASAGDVIVESGLKAGDNIVVTRH